MLKYTIYPAQCFLFNGTVSRCEQPLDEVTILLSSNTECVIFSWPSTARCLKLSLGRPSRCYFVVYFTLFPIVLNFRKPALRISSDLNIRNLRFSSLLLRRRFLQAKPMKPTVLTSFSSVFLNTGAYKFIVCLKPCIWAMTNFSSHNRPFNDVFNGFLDT